MSPHAHLARSPVGLADKVWLEAMGREPGENSPWYRWDWMGPPTLRYQGLDGAIHSPIRRKCGWPLPIASQSMAPPNLSPVPRKCGWPLPISYGPQSPEKSEWLPI